VLDQAEPNAFAAPGGPVYVSRGLLALAQSEDELASVLGHEITHVERRHTVRQMSRRWVPGTLLALPGRIVGLFAADVGSLLASPFEQLGALTMAKYGRSQEAESDEHGQQLAAAAGYDPAALGPILARMERFVAAVTAGPRKPSFFDSHPPTPDRVQGIAERATLLTAAPRAPGSLDAEAFMQRLDGMVFGANPAQGEFRGRLFVHPDLDVAIALPLGWKTINTARLAGAAEPDGRAMVFYGVAARGDAADAAKLAQKRREQLEREAGLVPARDEAQQLGDRTAHLLVYTDGSGSEAVHAFFVWIHFAGMVHQLAGLAPESFRSDLRACVDSLRTLTSEERESFEVRRLRLVAAQGGESIAVLGKRAGNKLDAATTAILNGVDVDATLPAGRLIKIVRAERYQPAR
jgi:predicted Zn-dependent protease